MLSLPAGRHSVLILSVLSLAAGLAVVAPLVAQPRYSPDRAVHSPDPDRFLAVFADGSRAKGPAMQSWPLLGAGARLEGKDLFAAENPVRLLRDQTAEVVREAPLVMLANGDVVNGSAVGLVEDAGGS